MSEIERPEAFLSSERIALIMGFAMPWRLAIESNVGALHPSLFDLLGLRLGL